MSTAGGALPDGTPCWLEIASPDPDETMRFYAEVFGWKFEARKDSAANNYVVATLFGEPVAGVVVSADTVRDWTLYLSTGRMDWAQEEAVRLGGAVISGSQQVPGVGTKVLTDDAAGATVGMCEPAADWRFTAGVPGTLVWAELVTTRATLADRFFGRIFDFGQRQFGDGNTVDYTVWYAGEASVIGRVRMAPDTPNYVRPRWIAHFAVDPDLGFDAAVHQARMAGAQLRFKPYPSSLGRVAVLSDPVGTRFALIDPALASEWEYGSGADDPYDD